MLSTEYKTGYVVGNNKGINDGNLLVDPYPYTNYGDADYMNGYKNGYLRGYFDRVKEKRATASQKTIEIINNQLRKISEIISEENTKEQQKTK